MDEMDKRMEPDLFVLDEGQSESELRQQLEAVSPLPNRAARSSKPRIPLGVFDCEYHPGLIGFVKDGTMKKRKVATMNSMHYLRYNDKKLWKHQCRELRKAGTYDDSDYEDTTREQRNLESKKDKIRRGEENQADVPEFPTTATCAEESPVLYDQVWDPARYYAKPADQVEKMDKFLEIKREANMTYHLMDLLHQSDYDLGLALSHFVTGPEWDRSVSLNDVQRDDFDGLLKNAIAKQKEFGHAASQIGCSKEAVMVNYYVWKGGARDTPTFKRLKAERNIEPNTCHVCDDGGSLVVCDLCKKAFHDECHKPPITVEQKASKTWYCAGCRISSPARLRRSPGLTNSNSGATPEASSPLRPKKLPTGPARLTPKDLAALKAIHKELSTEARHPQTPTIRTSGVTKKNQSCVPSGMVWDEVDKVWIESPKPIDREVGRDDSIVFTSRNTPNLQADEEFDSGSDQESVASQQPESPEGLPESDESSGQQSDEADESSVQRSNKQIDEESDEEYTYSEREEESDDDEAWKQSVFGPSQQRKAATSQSPKAYRSKPVHSDQFPGKLEYFACIPLTASGLNIIVDFDEKSGCTFKRYRGESNGPAERAQVFVSPGDRVIAVDGETCVDKKPGEMVQLFRKHTRDSRKVLKMLHTPH